MDQFHDTTEDGRRIVCVISNCNKTFTDIRNWSSHVISQHEDYTLIRQDELEEMRNKIHQQEEWIQSLWQSNQWLWYEFRRSQVAQSTMMPQQSGNFQSIQQPFHQPVEFAQQYPPYYVISSQLYNWVDTDFFQQYAADHHLVAVVGHQPQRSNQPQPFLQSQFGLQPGTSNQPQQFVAAPSNHMQLVGVRGYSQQPVGFANGNGNVAAQRLQAQIQQQSHQRMAQTAEGNQRGMAIAPAINTHFDQPDYSAQPIAHYGENGIDYEEQQMDAGNESGSSTGH